MIRDITIGQYYSADSPIHRLDPRVKIIGTLLYIISLFLFSSFAPYLIVFGFFGMTVAISKVPLSYIVKGLRPVIFMLIFTAVLNIFWTSGEVIFSIGVFHITREGLYKAVFISLRLIFLLIGASLLTLTTTPSRLTDGLESLLSPLKVFRAPVHEIAMMMSIALRFIPILIEETDRIMKAQSARGADFETGNFAQRIKNMIPIFIPLFVSAVRRAGELALAMDARCYHGGKNRTKMRPLRYQLTDFRAYVICFIYIALIIFVGRIT